MNCINKILNKMSRIFSNHNFTSIFPFLSFKHIVIENVQKPNTLHDKVTFT